MSDNKTRPTTDDVSAFLDSVEDDAKRADAHRVSELMGSISGEPPVMWGSSIVGFGTYHYRYDSGREGDAPAVGFSPRKANLTLYITGGFEEHADVLERLGKHKLGKGCLYIKRLSDVDESALSDLIRVSLENAARFNVAS